MLLLAYERTTMLYTLPLLQNFNLTLFLNQQGTQLQGKIVCSRTQEYDLYHGNLLDTKCIRWSLTLNQQGVKVWRRSTCRWQRWGCLHMSCSSCKTSVGGWSPSGLCWSQEHRVPDQKPGWEEEGEGGGGGGRGKEGGRGRKGSVVKLYQIWDSIV